MVALAALLRLPGLASRGRFDADQGHDMATLVAFVRNGVVPLLGPRTSVGEFHHGAFYYVLLAPAAGLSNGDPVVVTAFIALLGIAAVALTWWLARSIACPLAGFVAGLLLAVSPAGVEQSTFIWNPNPIACFAVLALAAAWKAHTGAAAGAGARTTNAWWAVAIGAAGAVTQLHVLGIVFLIAIVGLGILELRRNRQVVLGLVGGFGLVVVLFLPLIVHELQTSFQETGFVLDYLRGGDNASIGGPASALAFTLLRVTGWPIIGLVTDVPAAAALVLAATVGLAAIGLLQARGAERTGLAWLAGILVWSTVVLAFAAPSLQQVVAGLPNDHYHAFLDPIVVILIAAPAARLLERAFAAWRSTRHPARAVAAGAIAAGIAVILGIALVRNPPPVDPDGGWLAMRAAGERVVAQSPPDSIALLGLPTFKLPDAVGYPITYAGGHLVADPTNASRIVVACDRLFEAAIGAACGGPAEDALIAAKVGNRPDGQPIAHLVDRFDASPRTAISVYAR
ncbi:MAG TPA: phospholipid carrier-dependent glycosyltransferase [Candidatus Dormibacteraeota bacterium]|nr:phospholipid carrier-dependent glycosyltransferase [Candidatus Dormibacteraeota bacterium]